MDEKKRKDLFFEHIRKQKILIADPASSSRSRLAKTMSDLGAKSNLMYLNGAFEEAADACQREKPKVILSEYVIKNRSGFDLLDVHKESVPFRKDALFILITGDSEQSTVARAAEEDVDSFILKPYTIQSLSETIVNTLINKLHPGPYMKLIDQGKDLLFSGDPEQAKGLFKQAFPLDPKPTLAYFYYGQAEEMLKALEQASGKYKEGLEMNSIHFKCLTSLYDLLMKQKRYEEAYEVVRKIAKFFPANPKRLPTILKLAVMTKNYKDIEEYYEKFTALGAREDIVVKSMCAALIVSGKYYLISNARSKAVEVLSKVGVSSAGRTRFLLYVIETMVEYQLKDEAREFLKRFPADNQAEPEYLVAKYLVEDQEATEGLMSISSGQELVRNDVHHPLVYKAMIRRMNEAGKQDQAKELFEAGTKRWADFQMLTGLSAF